MKILFVANSLVSGGTERRLVELAKGLSKFPDVKLRLVLFSEEIHYSEIKQLDIKIDIIKRIPKKNPIVFYHFYRLCKSWKPDLIHSWGTMSSIWAIPSVVLLRIKLINGNIVNAPDNISFFDSEYFRAKITFPFSKIIVGNSKAGLKAYKVPNDKGICIYNGFDEHRISNLKEPNILKEELQITTKYIVGMVGSFSERKDYETYFNAANLILVKRNDITFLAVGEGPMLEKFTSTIPEKFTNHFRLTGARRDIESLVNIFTIGVLTTNAKLHGEGISNAILEYMALGKPTIATKCGGTPEIVSHMKTGILIPDNSAKTLVEKLTYLLENLEVRESMGNMAKTTIKNHFSLQKMTESYFNLYRGLVQ